MAEEMQAALAAEIADFEEQREYYRGVYQKERQYRGDPDAHIAMEGALAAESAYRYVIGRLKKLVEPQSAPAEKASNEK